MADQRAIFKVTSGPNDGDTVAVEIGACRLIGRHLSENETAFMDRDGNRMLDAAASKVLTEHLKEHTPETVATVGEDFSVTAFERGPDVIFSDDSISRAHAMLFFDPAGVGVIDLASTNGTYVNNVRVTSALVKSGDKVTLGSSELTVELK
jgi:hypothetical protein